MFPRGETADRVGSPIRSGFRPPPTVIGIFGEPRARVITLFRHSKKPVCGACGRTQTGFYDHRVRRIRDLPSGALRIYLQIEVRRVACRRCGQVKRERLDSLAENARYTRFAEMIERH